MEKDILSLIASKGKKLSKGHRQIASYIVENYDKAAFMTAGKLGRTLGVSESTVVRFAAELGYDRYPSMRQALQEMIRNRLTSVQRIEVAREQMDDSDILRSVLTSDMEKIQATLETIDTASFDRAVERIVGAEHVYIAGMRSSSSLAHFIGFYLNLVRENVHLVEDSAVSEVFEQIMRITSRDVFVGISYPRYSARTVRVMKYARSHGAVTVGITDGMNSPFAGIADIVLYAKSDMVSFLDSLVAPLSLINALIVAVGLRSERPISETFNALETVWKEYGIYERTDEQQE